MHQDINLPWTQVQFSELIGVSQQRVSQMLETGALQRDGTAAQWLRAYCRQLREQAAGRDGELTQNRARLALAQAEAAERKNAVESAQLAPIATLGIVLSDIARKLTRRLEALVPTVKRRCPELPHTAVELLEDLVREARNDLASVNIGQAEAIEDADLDADEEAPPA